MGWRKAGLGEHIAEKGTNCGREALAPSAQRLVDLRRNHPPMLFNRYVSKREFFSY